MNIELIEKVKHIHEQTGSPTKTAGVLNRNGIQTPKGKRWTKGYVSSLMHKHKSQKSASPQIVEQTIDVSLRGELKAILSSRLLSDKIKLMVVEEVISKGGSL